MINMNTVKSTVLAIIGAIGSGVAYLLGGYDMFAQTLISFMAVDYVLGVSAGALNKSTKSKTGGLSSKVGWKGLLKKGITLLVVMVAAQLDRVLELNVIRNGVIIAYISNELISIVENLGLIGVYIPAPIKKAIDILNQKSKNE